MPYISKYGEESPAANGHTISRSKFGAKLSLPTDGLENIIQPLGIFEN